MRTIYLETIIHAPIEKVFDLARSIDAHIQTTGNTHERVVAGKSSGLVELNDTITWRARHFGVYQNLTSVITEMKKPFMFKDKMTRGAFAFMEHTHSLESIEGGTKMTDVFVFAAPLGFIGRLVESLVLKKYMTRFLERRNYSLKQIAEKQV